jgi:hypothetical protein
MLKIIVIGIICGIGYLLLSGDKPIVEVTARVPACDDAVNKNACKNAFKASKQAAEAGSKLVKAVGNIKK